MVFKVDCCNGSQIEHLFHKSVKSDCFSGSCFWRSAVQIMRSCVAVIGGDHKSTSLLNFDLTWHPLVRDAH